MDLRYIVLPTDHALSEEIEPSPIQTVAFAAQAWEPGKVIKAQIIKGGFVVEVRDLNGRELNEALTAVLRRGAAIVLRRRVGRVHL